MSETTEKQRQTKNNQPPDKLDQSTCDLPPSELPPSEQTASTINRRLSGRMASDKSLLSLTYNNMKFRAPPDFRELLAEITKTILEEQPSNIPLFLSRYFKELDKDKVYQQQKEMIKQANLEAERVEKEKIKAKKQAEIKKKQAMMSMRAKKLAIMKANILAEAERQRQEDEKELQDNATYFTVEIIKQATAVRKEQILRENHKTGLVKLEEEKSEALHEITVKIDCLENQKDYLDDCMDTIYNRQMKAHRESLIQHKMKAEEYKERLIELEEFIEKVSDIVKRLNLEKPKLEAERVNYVETIDRLHIEKTDLVKNYNSRIIMLEIDFKVELEKIHKYLT